KSLDAPAPNVIVGMALSLIQRILALRRQSEAHFYRLHMLITCCLVQKHQTMSQIANNAFHLARFLNSPGANLYSVLPASLTISSRLQNTDRTSINVPRLSQLIP
ncbi:MAG: hypothetical protein AAFW47_03595, partial [Pseudomonadota bacterium]